MALKRKRSTPFISSPVSDISTTTTSSSDETSAIPFFYQQQKPISPLPLQRQKPTWSWPTYDDTPSSQLLNSRTRKRHRDDRPDEHQIHASTIQRLYDAQRKHPEASPMPSHQSIPAITQQQQPQSQPQSSTLHSFWRLPPTSTCSSQSMQIERAGQPPTSEFLQCEDCDGSLRTGDAMDIDESMTEQESMCAMCRRHVCDGCAVLGDERICLGCANGR
ncbi:hypothetical protein KC343_g11837 [Hortaea werneckii]|nr:hypothetical protein KC338_g9158 [Hortaea werneckii]KAI6873989.1 hypothetical protein KC323_g858 [Hortaea werneckii]KAI7166190.1 hypothetical protein KC352_g25907 [Hortaea werneckii]KAI7343908.1 hypothetical protein KC320_g9078 [Hortaea werneckii]KAI7610709.1 hypothetical protein KC343_g11837 [Hortaea werneckii]